MKMVKNDFYKSILKSAMEAGLPVISKYTAAKILFVNYKYGGGREEFTYCPKFLADIEFIQRMYGISGGETPDAEVVEQIQELDKEYTDEIPQWADDFCKERYGFSLVKISQNDINKNK